MREKAVRFDKDVNGVCEVFSDNQWKESTMVGDGLDTCVVGASEGNFLYFEVRYGERMHV